MVEPVKKWSVSLGLIGRIEIKNVEATSRAQALVHAAALANRYLRDSTILPDSRELGVSVEHIAARSVIDQSDYCCVVQAYEVGG